MLIDLSNSALVIDLSSSSLKPYQFSQINFWGFTKDRESSLYKLSSENIYSLLPRIIDYFETEHIPYSLSSSCQDYLAELNRLGDRYEKVKNLGKEFKEGVVDSAEFQEFSSFVNNNLVRILKDHQLKAAFHLYLVENGANFSVPGSGKTTVVLSVFEKLRHEAKVNLLFVVGPAACFGPWKTEFEQTFGRKPDWRILAGGEQCRRRSEYFAPPSHRGELYLTTYQTLLNDQEEIVTFFNQRGIKGFLVIDEGHYIKQIGGNWATAVLRISRHADYRCVLTGTPLPRSFTDVFNQFDFLWPYNNPIDRDTKVRIQIREENTDTESTKELLRKTVGPLFYRVRKSELGLIPPMFHPPIVLKMNNYERIIYGAIEKQIRNYSKEDYLRNIDLVKKLRRCRIIRLRQCLSNAKLLLTGIEDYTESLIKYESDLGRIIHDYDSLEIPAKLQYLKEFVGKLRKGKKKVIIWSNFIGTLKLIHKHLNQAGFYCKLIYGEIPTEQTSIDEEETREKIRNEFVDPKSGLDILILNPAACSESISLHTTCYHAIYYDLSYNCAQYLQSLDRIHRVGGSETHQANYYFLQYDKTIDLDIKANLEKKAKRMYDLIEVDYNIYSLDMFGEDEEVEAYERLFGEE